MTTEQDTLTAAYAAEAELGQTLSRRAMRQAGLTVLNVRRRARAMAREGEITADMTHEQIRDTMLDDLYCASVDVFAEFTGVDWDAILAFIEKLIPLILKIIALFG